MGGGVIFCNNAIEPINIWGIRKKRKKGAQKKGGANSPISRPLDPRLVKKPRSVWKNITIRLNFLVQQNIYLSFLHIDDMDAISRHISKENELISHQHRVSKRAFIPVKARD